MLSAQGSNRQHTAGLIHACSIEGLPSPTGRAVDFSVDSTCTGTLADAENFLPHRMHTGRRRRGQPVGRRQGQRRVRAGDLGLTLPSGAVRWRPLRGSTERAHARLSEPQCPGPEGSCLERRSRC